MCSGPALGRLGNLAPMRSRLFSWAVTLALVPLAAGAAIVGSVFQPSPRALLQSAISATNLLGFAATFGGPQNPLTVIVEGGREELISQGAVIAYFTIPDSPLDATQPQVPYTSDLLIPARCGTSIQFLRSGYLLNALLTAKQLANDRVSSDHNGFELATGSNTRLQISVRDGLLTGVIDLREIGGRPVPEHVDRIGRVGDVGPIPLPRPNDILPSTLGATTLGTCVEQALPPDFAPF